jgi:hypothetical protein
MVALECLLLRVQIDRVAVAVVQVEYLQLAQDIVMVELDYFQQFLVQM